MPRGSVKSKVEVAPKATRAQSDKKLVKDRMKSKSNRNDNHVSMETVEVNRKCGRNASSERAHKKSKTISLQSSDSELDYDEDNVRFQEDDEVVQITITNERAEFPSDNEATSAESDSEEEGEVREDSDKTESERGKVVLPDKSNKHNQSRQSVEDQIENLNSTVMAMKEMMCQKGILDEFEGQNKSSKRQNQDNGKGKTSDSDLQQSNDSNSVTTIYRAAVEQDVNRDQNLGKKVTLRDVDDPEIVFRIERPEQKRDSSSSEEQIDTSDELIDVDNFIADCEASARRVRDR